MSVLQKSGGDNGTADYAGKSQPPTEVEERATGAKAADPFDPSRFRLAQNYAEIVGGKKILTRVPVGRPDKQAWFMVNPSDEFMVDVNVLEVKSDNEVFLVDPMLALEISQEVVAKRLFVYTTVQGDVGIWPVKLPDIEGKLDPWNESALVAAAQATKKWIRLLSNRALSAYDVMESAAPLGPPQFGEKKLNELLEIAFRGKVIQSSDHPLLRRLRGEK